MRFGKNTGDKAKIENAIERGQHLLKIAETSERLSIIGSAYKKLAELVRSPSEIRKHLKEAAAYYGKAAKMQEQEPLADPYLIMNWLTIEAILENHKVPYESWMSKCEILSRQRFQAKHEVWDLFAAADIALLRAFQSGSLPKERTKIVEKYRAIFAESAATPREQDSVFSQITFIRDSYKKLSSSRIKQKDAALIVEALDEIHTQLKHPSQSEKLSSGKKNEPKETAKPPRTRKSPKKQPTRSKTARAKSSRRPKGRGKA